MPPFPLAARVVEVIADLGEANTPRYRVGSGCIVAGRTVLTAAHVVMGAVSVLVRGTDKVVHRAVADPVFTGDAHGPGPDLALVEIIDGGVDVPPMGLAMVKRDSSAGDPVERCHVIGYPAFMEREAADGSRFRETADALGELPVLSGLAGGLVSVQVSSSPEPLPPAQHALANSPWSGMSGGPVVADGYLLAVVTEHAPRAGPSAITATPVTALKADPAHPGWGPGVTKPAMWWSRLGVADPVTLHQLPAAPGRIRPAYWATVQEIRQRTGILTGRQHELAAIASFATGDDGYRWLVGESWAGKTSLLAEAVLTLNADIDVACYFLSRREADADSSGFLAAVVPQLAYLLHEDVPPADLQQFRALWQRAAERAGTDGRHVLLVVDGLDEDLRPPGLPSVAALLPATAGGRAHVLVSSRPYPDLPADIPAGHPMRFIQPVLVEPFVGARELEVLAQQEIDDLLRRDDDGLAADVLGLLAAAAGPLAVRDLAAMTIAAPPSPGFTRRIRGLLTTSAARSLQPIGPAGGHRYQFAHESLLAYAQADDDLNDPDFRCRVHQWAEGWQAAGWPIPAGRENGTPQYLLDSYPSTLTFDRQRLEHLVTDIGWAEVAIGSVGVDRVLADLQRAIAANPTNELVSAIYTAVTGQAHNLRSPQPLDQPGYVLRQLWMQSAELGEDALADNIRSRLRSLSGLRPAPEWTTRRASRALSRELGRHKGKGWVQGLAVLADGRVVSGGDDGWVLVWDPANPGASPIELGRHNGGAFALAVLADGQVVSGGDDGWVLVWDPANPGASPIELGRHYRRVRAVAVLADGRIVTGGSGGPVLVWDPANPGADPVELGDHDGLVGAVAVLADGRVITSGSDQKVLIWDPANPSASPVQLSRHDAIVRAVQVLPDGRVISGDTDGRLLLWNLTDLGADPVELGRRNGTVGAIAALADGRVVTGGSEQKVLIWDPADSNASPVELGRHDGMVRAVVVLGDGRVVTGGDRRVMIWDLTDLRASAAESDRRDGLVRAVAMFADGRVVTGVNRRVLIWDLGDPGADPVLLGHHRGNVQGAAVLADGRVVTGGADGRVLIWDPSVPGARPTRLGRRRGKVRGVVVLADGRVMACGNAGALIWDPASPDADPVELGHDHGLVRAVAVLSDGRVVTGGDAGVLIWDPASPDADPVELGSHDGTVQAVAVLPDGRVVTGGDQKVLISDPTNPGVSAVVLGRHDGAVRSVAALNDGWVVTGGTDQRVLVWDPAETDSQVAQLKCSVTVLATTPIGTPRSNLLIAHVGYGFSFWSFLRRPR